MLRMLLTTLRALVFGRPVEAQPTSSGVRADTAAERLRQHLSVLAKSTEGGCLMNAAYEKLIQHLDEHHISYLTNSEHHSICADFRGEVGTHRIVATVESDDNLFQVFGYSPVRVPQGSRPAIGETITRANYCMKVGKFEMDLDQGDLRFQAAQILPYDTIEDETIRRLIGTAMGMLDTYLPAVLSVIYGNELPQDAIKCVEKRQNDSGGANSTPRGATD